MHPDFIEIDDKFSDRETTDREYCLLEQEKQISDDVEDEV
jgi:hypothetical protein